MIIYINSAGRADTICTHRAIGELDYRAVVHDADEAARYEAAAPTTGLDPARIVVSGAPRTCTAARQFILGSLMAPGEWAVIANDNIRRFLAVPAEHYEAEALPVERGREVVALYDTPCPPGRAARLLDDLRARADALGVHYGGLASNSNGYFRARHWRAVGWVTGKLQLIRRGDLDFPLHITCLDDAAMTSAQLYRHGRLLIDNFLYADSPSYAAGGIGSRRDRLPARLRECAWLVRAYAGLWRYKPYADLHPRADLRMALHTPEQVDRWRRELRRKRLKVA